MVGLRDEEHLLELIGRHVDSQSLTLKPGLAREDGVLDRLQLPDGNAKGEVGHLLVAERIEAGGGLVSEFRLSRDGRERDLVVTLPDVEGPVYVEVKNVNQAQIGSWSSEMSADVIRYAATDYADLRWHIVNLRPDRLAGSAAALRAEFERLFDIDSAVRDALGGQLAAARAQFFARYDINIQVSAANE
jgi:hypothetical protein